MHLTDEELQKEVERIFDEFWKDIIYKDGEIDIEQIKKELYDYSCLLDEVPKVYMEVSNGRISKPNTAAFEVIAEFNNCVNDLVQEAIEEYKENIEKS